MNTPTLRIVKMKFLITPLSEVVGLVNGVKNSRLFMWMLPQALKRNCGDERFLMMNFVRLTNLI